MTTIATIEPIDLISFEEVEESLRLSAQYRLDSDLKAARATYDAVRAMKEAGIRVDHSPSFAWADVHLGRAPASGPERAEFFQQLTRIRNATGLKSYENWKEPSHIFENAAKVQRKLDGTNVFINYHEDLRPDGPCRIVEVEQPKYRTLVCDS